MNFLLSAEQIQLRDSVRGFLEDTFPLSSLRGWCERDDEKRAKLQAHWRAFSQLGVLLGGVSEARGGLGLGFLSNIVVLKECGRTLAPLPVLETLAFGILPLRLLSTETHLEALLSGDEIATGIVGEESVPEAKAASYVITDDGGEVSLAHIQIEGGASSSADLMREFYPLSSMTLVDVETVGPLGDAALLPLERLLLVAAEMLGAARTIEAMTLEYVKTRKQFGVPIGTFQALQQKLADCRVSLDSAESLLHFAAWARDHDLSQFPETALAAYLQSATETKRVAEVCLQTHGGIGFTFEYDLHLFLRRILNLRGWFSNPGALARELGERVVSEW